MNLPYEKPTTPKQIADGLLDLEREWVTGWQGPGGAAYNVIATGLHRKGLLRGLTEWRLSELGEQVRQHLIEDANDG